MNKLIHFLNITWVLPILIGTINLLLKLHYITFKSIQLDEPFSIFYAQQPLSKLIPFLLSGNNAPLYEVILHFWINTFGIEACAVRLPSVLFSCITAVVIYLIGFYNYSRTAGIVASILFTLSMFHFGLAHEARAYALFYMLCTISIWSYLNWVNKHKPIWLIVSTTSNVLLFYTHYLGIIVIATQILGIFLYPPLKKFNIKSLVISFATTLLLIFPLLLVFTVRFSSYISGGTWLSPPEVNELYEVLRKFLNAPVSTVIFLALLISASVKWMKKKEKLSFASTYLLLLFPAIYLFVFMVSQWAPVFLDKYLGYISITLYVLIGAAVCYLIPNNKIRGWIILIIICIYPLTLKIKKKGPYLQNLPIKAAVDYVKQQVDSNTLVLIAPAHTIYEFGYYLNRNAFRDYPNFITQLNEQKVISISHETPIPKSIYSAKNLIYIEHGNHLFDKKNRIYTALSRQFNHFEKSTHFQGIKITRFYN